MSPAQKSGNSASLTPLPSRIEERAAQFSGRAWVFAEIDQWLTPAAGSRYFLITGEPGSGKTAIAVRLFQFSSAAVPSNGYPHLAPGSISAAHFCSAGDADSLDPRSFAVSIALQLSARSPAFAHALKDIGDKTINIVIDANLEQVDTFNAVVIQNLDVSRLNSQEAFNRVVLDPLRRLTEPLTILVDSLDEALNHTGDVNIVKLLSNLESLPQNVRFILTSRRDDRVEAKFPTADGLLLSQDKYNHSNRDDILEYINRRMTEPALANLDAGLPDRLADLADGNFQYAKFVVNAIALGRMDPLALAGLPPGLDPIYYASFALVVGLGKKDWSKEYSPVMGVLSVAQEHPEIALLCKLSHQPESAVWACITDLQQFVETENSEEPRYSLFHHSVTEFLQRRQITLPKRTLHNLFYLPPAEWHRRVADLYPPDQLGAWDLYGFRYTATHLAQAARRSSGQERHANVTALARLTTNPQFRSAHMDVLHDLPRLQADLQESVAVASQDDLPEGLELVVQSSLALVNFRRTELRPEPLFDLAAQGHVESATQRLALFSVDEEWRQIALALIAWLSSGNAPTDAAAIRTRVGNMPHAFPRVARVLEYCDAQSGGPPPTRLPLPPPLPFDVMQAILDRMGGNTAGSTAELLASHNIPDVRNPSLRANEGYLSQLDGPHLVAFVQADPSRGQEVISQYIGIHTNYHYVEYRARSLAFLLDAVLNHFHPAWVQVMATKIACSALAGSRSEFQEALPIAVAAVEAASNPAATALLLKRNDALKAAAAVELGRKHDPFSRSKRRLAALCEAFGYLGDLDDCKLMTETALAILRKGFAGFSAPASLHLAEAIDIAQVPVPHARGAALDSAVSAAHNVQDPLFCARTTARVNAMLALWWYRPFDLVATVERFCRDRDQADFCATHLVGENFRYRSPDSMALSDEIRYAQTLDQIEMGFGRSPGELTPYNPELPRRTILTLNTPVRIPDPGFATWLAARFAAAAMADRSLPADRRLAMIRALVPIAAANPTALDTVLSRLILAGSPPSAATLARIREFAEQAIDEPEFLEPALPA